MPIKKVYYHALQYAKHIAPALSALDMGQCISCGCQTHSSQRDICDGCALSLQMPTSDLCQRCSLPLPSSSAIFCAECLSLPPHFTKTVALGLYQFPLNKMLHAFKHQGHLPTGKVLAGLLGEQVAQQYQHTALPECLVPVPLHWRRHWHRGFNQTAEIANNLSRQLTIPVNHNLCKKRHSALQQKTLNKKQRQKSLKHSFIIPPDTVTYQHIALIDDVMTTGATARALSRAFALKGVTSIDCWVIARTPKSPHT